jgi:REP element-mobilizing transposase RayT
MANTYTQIHIHAIFAVQNRLSLIQKQWQDELYKYISGIISNNGHKLLTIGGMPDHIHPKLPEKIVTTEVQQRTKGQIMAQTHENKAKYFSRLLQNHPKCSYNCVTT